MAKRKQTATQRKAKQRAAYYRREYYATREAIEFMQGFTPVKLPKIPSKITKTSLKSIRKLYKETRQKIKPMRTGGYLDVSTGEFFETLPTKKEMVKKVRAEQAYRQYRAEPEEAPPTFDPDAQYIDTIKEKLEAISQVNDAHQAVETAQPRKEDPRVKTEQNFERNVKPKFDEAMNRILGAIDAAVAQVGYVEAARILAENDFMQRIENLEEKYTYEIIEGQGEDGDIVTMIEASVTAALAET